MKTGSGRSLVCAAALYLGAAICPALAQEAAQGDASLSLELNNARDTGNSCRITYLANNGTGKQLEKTSYQIVVFDAGGKVSQFLILEFGKLANGKTKAVEFDFANRGCKDISRILVNDVSECIADGSASPLCMDGLKTATRTEIGFGL